MVSKFEVGKCYQHASGLQLHITGVVDTVGYGKCFVGETGIDQSVYKKPVYSPDQPNPVTEIRAELQPVSMDDSGQATVGYEEISKEKFIKDNYGK